MARKKNPAATEPKLPRLAPEVEALLDVRRLLYRLIWQAAPQPPERILQRSVWRRRH